MTDRDPLLSAVRFLYQTKEIEIPVKFYTEHVIRNIVSIYSIPKAKQQLLRTIIMGL